MARRAAADRHPVKRQLSALLAVSAAGLILLVALYSTQIYYGAQGERLLHGFHEPAIALAQGLQGAYFSARVPRGVDRSVLPRLSDPVAFTSQAELAYNEIAQHAAKLFDLYAGHPGPPFDAVRARLTRAEDELRALYRHHEGDPEGFARAFSTAPLYVEVVAEQIARLHEAQRRTLRDARSRTALASWVAFLAAAAALGMLVFWRARRNLRAIDAILAGERAHIAALRESEAALQERKEQLRVALAEKEALLREVYHRVKNNMQVVASLLAIQSRAAGPGQAQHLLKESAERVESMALVHEQLYRSRDLGRIAVAEYIGTLLGHLGHIYSAAARGISTSTDIAPAEIGVDDAVPLGLIVCELVSNACKHAFPEGGGGAIRVALQPLESGDLELTVSDDGRGAPAGWEPGGAATLGSQLVAALSRQLGGTFRLAPRNGRGASFKVRFPRPGRGSAPEG